jgi:hypothetical protein
MIQALKYQNWAKLHPKQQKEPTIFMMGTRGIFFRNFENTTNMRRTPNQPIAFLMI